MKSWNDTKIFYKKTLKSVHVRGGGVSKEIRVQSACQYNVTPRVSDFQNGDETDKNFYFITEILFRFLGFGDFKVSIVIEN